MPRQITKRPKTVESRKNNALTDNTQAPPKISLPWPPVVSADDFVRNRPISKVDIKSPNSFFVYRAAVVKQLLIEQHKFKMTQVSKWASIYWKGESKEVKDAYKRMAQRIDREFQEKRKAIKGYQIICENFIPESEFQEKREQQNFKQEPIKEQAFIQHYPPKEDPTQLISWQPQDYSEYYVPYIPSVSSPGSASSDTTAFDSNYDTPGPMSPEDFSLFENPSNFNSNTDHYYLPTQAHNNTDNYDFCIAPVFNAYSSVGDDNVAKSVWKTPNGSIHSSPTIIDYATICIEQGSCIENIENSYLWNC